MPKAISGPATLPMRSSRLGQRMPSSSSKGIEEAKTTLAQSNNDVAPKVLTSPETKSLQVASSENNTAKVSTVRQLGSNQRSALRAQSSSLVSSFAPGNAPGNALGNANGNAPGIAARDANAGLPTDSKASLLEEKSSIPERTPSTKVETANALEEDVTAPIYAVIREVLESEVTYQVVGGVTSVVVVSNALLTAASKLGLANLAGNLPARLPVNNPTPSSSMISNRFNPKLMSRL